MKIEISLPGSMHDSHGKPVFNGDIEVTIINDHYGDAGNLTNVVEFCDIAVAKVGKNIPCVHPVRDLRVSTHTQPNAKNNTDGDNHRDVNSVEILNLCYMPTVDDKEEDKVRGILI